MNEALRSVCTVSMIPATEPILRNARGRKDFLNFVLGEMFRARTTTAR
jgi:hypothetical protein